jgi:hypothetical protein
MRLTKSIPVYPGSETSITIFHARMGPVRIPQK